MRLRSKLLLLPTLALLSACVPAAGSPARATANILDGSGRPLGTATFVQSGSGTKITVSVSGLAPRSRHGLHLHAGASCADSEDNGSLVKFGAAGAHFDPLNTKRHAGPLVSANRGHAGDLPYLMANARGEAVAVLNTTRLSVRQGPISVLGRSIIVHEGGDSYDDLKPNGGGGGRIGCGVVTAI
ncbi:superoxide dismutase family protein [Deinococcus sp.]|uniref:superoxide dismutase family protein n=1 Tax=Deinococcus sp. TaxID=47478 RepID=UPI0025FCF9B6|nr:superoxide dismutase family protein [Deinococcus sp.]